MTLMRIKTKAVLPVGVVSVGIRCSDMKFDFGKGLGEGKAERLLAD